MFIFGKTEPESEYNDEEIELSFDNGTVDDDDDDDDVIIVEDDAFSIGENLLSIC